MQTKKPWQSKTNWVALVTAILAFFPSAKEWVAANPEAFMWVISVIFAGLRLVTKDRIAIK